MLVNVVDVSDRRKITTSETPSELKTVVCAVILQLHHASATGVFIYLHIYRVSLNTQYAGMHAKIVA